MKFSKKLNNIIALYIIFLLVFSSIIIAPDEGEGMILDNFNNLENPSINDFNSMSGVDQGLYLATNYNQEYATSYYSDISNLGQNPDVDAQYFSDPNNIGKNPEADDAFFSGSYSEDNSLGNLRSNFENYKESASEYLTGKYGQTYVVSEVVEDFVYSADGVLINNGIEISLSEYQFDSTISEIRAVSSGFEIVKNDGQIISFSGDQAEGKGVSYNSEYGTVEVIGSDGHQTDGFLVNQGENVDDVNFDLSTNGKLSITGPVSGYLVEGNVRFNNRQGTLTISADRTFFEADNAEVITPSFYVDGQFRKEDNLVTTWSHGCTSCGNINDGETVFVDRTTDVGVITRGQNRNAGNQVEIHLDEISPNSEFYTSPDESSGEDVSEDARERARQVQPPQGDSNDGNAEVYIKKNYDTQEVIVYGSGPFEVAFHNVDPAGSATLDSTRSHFVGQNGMSGFDASFNPGTGDKINVRGQAEYSDLQYNLIDTKQNGASLRIERPTSFQEDSMVVDCVSCTVGSEVVSISKPMSLVQGGGGVYQAYQEIDSANFEISVVVDENGLGYSFSNTAVGELAKKQGDDNEVIMGRDLVMVVDSDENELTYFNIAHDSEGNAGGFVQVFDNTNFPENTLVSETRVDLGINGAIGDRQLIVSDEQYEQVQQVLTYIENSDFEGLAEAGIDIYDAEIRNLILSETYIDIDRVGEMGYIQQVTDAVDQRKQFLEYQQEVFDDYGILLDDNGLCVGSADICASIQDAILNQDEMAWYVTRAQGQALEAQNTFLEAQLDSGIVSPIDAEILIEANEEQIRDLQGVRAWMDSEVNTRLVLEGIQAGDVPEGSEDDISAVEDYNSKKRHWIGERIRLEYELTSLKAQVVETPSGVSETIEQDLIQSRIWELEDSIENIGISIANLDESTTKVAVQYAAERPDFAINLCSRSGSECAADLMEELEGTGIENSPLVQEAARDMVRFELNQNDDIVSARAYAETITDEQTRQEADELLVRHFNSQLDELQSDLAQEKRRLELEHEERFSGVLGGLEYITDKVIDPQSSIALAAEGAVTYVNIYGSIASLALGKDVCTDTSGPDCEGYQWKDGDYTTTYEEDKKILENSIASLEEDIQEIETTRFDVRYDTDLGGYGPFEERTIIGSSEELLDYHQVTNPSLRAILKQASGEELNNNDRVDIAIYNYNRDYEQSGERFYRVRGEAAELLETIEYYEQNDPNFENRYGDKVTLIEQNIAHAEEFSLNLADNQFVTESLLAEGIRKAGSVDAFIPIASIGHVATSLARTTRVATTLSKVDDLATAGVRVLGSGLGDTTTSTLSKFVQGAGDVVTTPIDSTTYKLYMDLRTARNLEKSGARTIEDVELIQRAIDVNKYAKSQKSGVFTREVTDLFGKNKEIHDDLDTALKSFDLAADIGITSDDVDILLKAASDVQSLKLAKTGTKTVNTAAKFEDTARIERAEATDVMDTARRQAQGNAPESSLVVQSDAARSRALDVPENGPGTGNAIDDLAETTPSHSSMQTVFGGSTDETVQGLLDERGQLLIDGQPATSGGLVRGREIDYEIMRREFRGADGAVDLQDSRLIAMDGMSDSEGLARGFVRTGGNLELDTAYQVAKPEGSLVATFDEATTGFSVDRVVDDVPEVVSTADEMIASQHLDSISPSTTKVADESIDDIVSEATTLPRASKVDESIVGGEVWELDGAEYIYREEVGWSRRGISDLDVSGNDLSLSDLADLTSAKVLHDHGVEMTIRQGSDVQPGVLEYLDDGARSQIEAYYLEDPAGTVSQIHDNVLAELNLGVDEFQDALRNTLGSEAREAALLDQFSSFGTTVERSPSGDLVLPQTPEYVQGRFGVVLEENGGVKRVMYVDDGGEIQIAEYASGDTWFRGSVDQTPLKYSIRQDVLDFQVTKATNDLENAPQKVEDATKRLEEAQQKLETAAPEDLVEVKKKVEGATKDLENALQEFEDAPELLEIAKSRAAESRMSREISDEIEIDLFPRKPPSKTNKGKVIEPLDDVSELEITVGFSDDVDAIGENVIEISAPIEEVLEDGSTMVMREFTIVDELGNVKILKYPTEIKNPDGTIKTLLFEREAANGRTIFASNDIESFIRQRLPETLDDIVEQGKTIYLHEGNRQDVMGSLMREGFDTDSIKIFPSLEEKVAGYELWEATNPLTGEVRYLFANFKGSSKRQHIEAALLQSGYDQSRIVVVDHNTDYKALYLGALENGQPDAVLIGTGDTLSKGYYGVKSSGAGLDTEGLTSMSAFHVTSGDQTQKVVSTVHPNGELSRYFMEALVEYHQKHPVKIVFSGDSGSLGPFRQQLTELNDGIGATGNMIHQNDMFTPSKFITNEGRVIDLDNPMTDTVKARLDEGRVIEGRKGEVDVLFDTVHGNAFSANQEDIGYLVREVDRGSDTIDVEGSFIAEVLDDAVKEGKDVPETAFLFHSSDEVATGAPIATEGHEYHAKKVKHDMILEHITGSKLEDITITTKHPNPPQPPTLPKPKSLPVQFYEAYGVESGTIKRDLGKKYGQLKGQGNSDEEIWDLLIKELEILNAKASS